MGTVSVGTWRMDAADLGECSPLPPIRRHKELHKLDKFSGLSEEMQRNIRYGHVDNLMPYGMQNCYGRKRAPREFKTAVLENDCVRATFLLELGGRLWSLFDKRAGRELFYVTPVFQPANLAVRNAWFCGGVEWNVGIRGHSPLTCSPVFAARVSDGMDGDFLRLYEWERIRGTPYQLDFHLPPGARTLLAHVRILNPHAEETPMYWWSNIAVPELAETRVLAPAEKAYAMLAHSRKLGLADLPCFNNEEATYPSRIRRTIEFFFNIPPGRRPWIAALNGDGAGLAHTSTVRLKGRKFFTWGGAGGGRRWQEFLSGPGVAYLEIQAGLACTQLESIPMPPRSTWSWTESYGFVQADPAAIHGADWPQAVAAAEREIERLMPQALLAREEERLSQAALLPPAELLHRGSGWGALEALRRERAGEPAFAGPELAFDRESLGAEQRPWLELLERGAFPTAAPEAWPGGFMAQREWRALLEKATGRDVGNWNAWQHLGLLRYQTGDTAEAEAAWRRSLEITETPWALRNLAVLAHERGDSAAAADLYVRACGLAPSLLQLAAECGRYLVEENLPERWLKLLASLPRELRTQGRIRLLESWAHLGLERFDEAERIFLSIGELTDIREGELTASELWEEIHVRRMAKYEGIPADKELRRRARREFPIPGALDFRTS